MTHILKSITRKIIPYKKGKLLAILAILSLLILIPGYTSADQPDPPDLQVRPVSSSVSIQASVTVLGDSDD